MFGKDPGARLGMGDAGMENDHACIKNKLED
jgi:hypothetical protein